MNKTYQLCIAVILMILASAVISHTRLVLAQEASPTATASITATPSMTQTSTKTHSPTNTLTPTPLPTQTPTSLPISTNTQIPLPTPYTVDDIHSQFTSDFENIDKQLSEIYNQVYAPPGASIIENVFSNFLYDLVKPSSEANSIIYLLAKIIGSLSLVLKVSIVFIKNKDSGGIKLINGIVTTIIFLYALIFLGILFRPQVIPYEAQAPNETDATLSSIENQLSAITNYIKENPAQSTINGQATTTNGADLGNVERQLVSISDRLQTISVQDQESVATLNTKLDEIKALAEETKDLSAKRGLQWVSFFILVVLLILSVLRGDAEKLFRRFGS